MSDCCIHFQNYHTSPERGAAGRHTQSRKVIINSFQKQLAVVPNYCCPAPKSTRHYTAEAHWHCGYNHSHKVFHTWSSNVFCTFHKKRTGMCGCRRATTQTKKVRVMRGRKSHQQPPSSGAREVSPTPAQQSQSCACIKVHHPDQVKAPSIPS